MGGSPARSRAARVSGVRGRGSGVTRTSQVGSLAPGNEPPPTSDSPSTSSASAPTAFCDVFGEHTQYGNLNASPLRISIEDKRRLERRERELVRPHRPGEGIVTARLDRRPRAE